MGTQLTEQDIEQEIESLNKIYPDLQEEFRRIKSGITILTQQRENFLVAQRRTFDSGDDSGLREAMRGNRETKTKIDQLLHEKAVLEKKAESKIGSCNDYPKIIAPLQKKHQEVVEQENAEIQKLENLRGRGLAIKTQYNRLILELKDWKVPKPEGLIG